MEWKEQSFSPQRPEPPPNVHVKVDIIRQTHERFGKTTPLSLKQGATQAVADSGCQTCTAGPEILSLLNCPKSYLISTRHKTIGITGSPLEIMGALFLKFELNDHHSNQMVYVSKNCKGLYLSQTAMKDLGIVEESFPNTQSSACAQGQSCPCIPRTPTPPRPTEIPFEPIESNIPKLKDWLLKTFESSAFNQCAHQPLPQMTGEPMKVEFKNDCKPYAVHTPIPVPHHWKERVKEDLDRDVRLGIIEKVPQGTSTEWCARMVVTAKKNGDPRRTVDLQQLNKATLRETHHTPTPFDLVSTIPPFTRKTVVDAWNGYHSLALDENAKNAITFITEWGRYRYRRAPMGFHVSGDAYTRRFDDITIDEQRTVRCVDDTLLWDDSIEQSFWHTFDYLKLCNDNGIVFNTSKFQFAQETAEFAGFEITKDGYKPLRKIIEAIQNFPTPKSITDVRSWFGLVNQLAYSFAQARVMEPFRKLLSSKTFYWDEQIEQIFVKSKAEIVKLVQDGVKTFVRERPTCLITDWSKTGIGFHLTQKHCNCPQPSKPDCGKEHWKLIFAGSRFTKDSESRYAPIEGEALAVAFGLKRCRMFVMGAPHLTVVVDHKPLVNIFNDRELSTIENPRVRNFKEKTLMYNFDIIHFPGKSKVMKISDIASRNPVKPDDDESSEIAAVMFANAQGDGVKNVSWETVKNHAIFDEECSLLAEFIANGFPKSKDELPIEIRSYWSMKDDLYLIQGVPFKGKKMLIPASLRQTVLEGLHAAHQGVSSMLANARERFFWPGLDAAVRVLRDQCRQCNEQAPSQRKEPTISTDPPEYPFQQVAIDLFKLSGFGYIIYVDAYSGWIEVATVNYSTFEYIKKVLLMYFSIFGVPQELASDGGPPFDSFEYRDFLTTWNIHRRLSSAYYPQSNGRAEVGVKTAKRILLGNVDPKTGRLDNEKAVKALLTHRNTPCQQTGTSPAIALFGRPVRDHLPIQEIRLQDGWNQIADNREQAMARKQHITVDHSRKPLDPLNVGDTVQIQNQKGSQPTKWHNTGYITDALPNRQYRVMVDGSRRVTLRNRRFLRPILESCRRPEVTIAPPQIQQTPSPLRLDEPSCQPSPPPKETITEGGQREVQREVPTLRRSTRERRPPRALSPKMSGQSHD